MSSTLITMPLTFNYLEAELIGGWILVCGIVVFIDFIDLGIEMGFQNALSKTYEQDGRHTASAIHMSTLYS